MALHVGDVDNDDADTTSAAIRKAARLTAFIVGTTIDDCRVNHSSGKLLSIKGCEARNITCEMLQKFCSVHSITGYKSLNKDKMCALIVERCNSARVESAYYPEDNFDENEESGYNDKDTEEKEEKEEEEEEVSPNKSAIDNEMFEWDEKGGVGGVGIRSPREGSTDGGESGTGDDVPPVAITGAAASTAGGDVTVTVSSRSGRTSATPASEKKKQEK